MNTLCRECGKPSTPEYTDEHDGLCMTCWHRDRMLIDHVVDGIAVTLMSGGLVDIDHEIVKPQATDPIRDAIDRAWGEYYRDVGGDA